MSHQKQIHEHRNLCEAIVNEDKVLVRKLIRKNADLNVRDKTGNTPLHLAIIKLGYMDITILLDKGPDIHARNHDNYTPLDIAVLNGKTGAVSLLLRKGALVEADLNRLLDMAIGRNNPIIVEMIISNGIQDNPSMNLMIHLNVAISQKSVEIIEVILPHCGFSQQSDLYIPRDLVVDADFESRSCVELLVDWNFTIHPDSRHDEDFIYAAVEEGYSSIVTQLLEQEIDVNMVNPKTGLNLLTTACLNKHHEIVEKLLQRNADVNVTVSSENGKLNNYPWFSNNIHAFSELIALNDDENNLVDVTCLHIAVFNSDLKAIDILLKYGAIIMDDGEFFNLTCYAVRYNYEEIVRIFLAHGVNVADINSKGETLLHFCFNFPSSEKNDHYNVAKLLLEKGANIHLQSPGNSLVFETIKNGHCKIAQLFLDYNADVQYVSPDGDTLLHSACDSENLQIIEALLKRGANPNATDGEYQTPLHVACKSESDVATRIIQLLLQHGANIEARDVDRGTPLFTAYESNRYDVVQYLLDNHSNVHATINNGLTLFHIACQYPDDWNPKIIQLLLEHGANIEVVDDDGWTPLLTACDQANEAAIEYLLDNHANVNARDKEGHTPLHIICYFKNAESLIELLLEHGADIEAVGEDGWTPLFNACTSYNYATAKYLLDRNANSNHPDGKKATPLHVAVNLAASRWTDFERPYQLVPLLIKHGADVNVVDEDKQTPLHNAVKKMLSYSNNNSNDSSSIHRTCQTIIKILVSQGIKLKTAGLKVNNHKPNGIFKSDDYITIDNVKYSAFDIVQLNVDSDSNDVGTGQIIFDDEDFVGDIRQLKDKCEQEIEMMKKENISVDDFTLYDLLEGNIYRLGSVLEDDEIQQRLDTTVYEDMFPLYIDIVRNQFRDAKIRYGQYMLRISAREYFTLRINKQLPDECVDMILKYLNIEELKTFIEAMDP